MEKLLPELVACLSHAREHPLHPRDGNVATSESLFITTRMGEDDCNPNGSYNNI